MSARCAYCEAPGEPLFPCAPYVYPILWTCGAHAPEGLSLLEACAAFGRALRRRPRSRSEQHQRECARAGDALEAEAG